MAKKAAKQGPNKTLWPVLGLFMAISLGVISWFIAPIVKDIMVERIASFSGNEMPQDQLQALIAAVIFIVLLGVTGLLIAFTVPRNQNAKLSSRKRMLGERKEMLARHEAKKQRRRRVEQEMHKY